MLLERYNPYLFSIPQKSTKEYNSLFGKSGYHLICLTYFDTNNPSKIKFENDKFDIYDISSN
jgi:hypothetical protein